MFGPLRHIFLFDALHLPRLRDINTRSRIHKLTQAQSWHYVLYEEAHPVLEISHAFLHRLNPISDLADVTDISTGSRSLIPSISLV